MSHIIIGTAGHIDHGKTELVKALTGMDTDRLPEEKKRGLTIDLGFAFYGENAAIIDVPGHERFIKNMVAGVATIDLVLFVIAADDGIMPQTREHLDILNLLGVKKGLVAITKIDLVERDWLDLVIDEVHKFVEGTFLDEAPILPVSSTTGEGIEALRKVLDGELARAQAKPFRQLFRMPIDRVFTIKGFGTVVTGTVLSGTVRVGQTLELLPQRREMKIRGIQKHGRTAETARAGDRAALNPMGIGKNELARGDVLAQKGYLKPSPFLDARLNLLKSARGMKNRTRVRLHIGTKEILCRVVLLETDRLEPGGTEWVQFLLESPYAAIPGDAFVIRSYSPQLTIGGGRVIHPHPPKHRRFQRDVLQFLRTMAGGNPREIIEAKLMLSRKNTLLMARLVEEGGVDPDLVKTIIAELVKENIILSLDDEGKILFHRQNIKSASEEFIRIIENFHRAHPDHRGLALAELKAKFNREVHPALFEKILKDLEKGRRIKREGNLVRLATYRVRLSPQREKLINRIEEILLDGGVHPSGIQEIAKMLDTRPGTVNELATIMQDMGKLARVDNSHFFHQRMIEQAREKISQFLNEQGEVTISEVGKLLNTSRKYSVPLMEYFDAVGFTERRGDVRVKKG